MRACPVIPIVLTNIFTSHYLVCLCGGENGDFESWIMGRPISEVLDLKGIIL